MKACICATGADIEGPARECPLHGDLTARYGLRGNAYLLGRSFESLANRVRFVRKLSEATDTSNRSIELIDAVLHAVSRPENDAEMSDALAAVKEAASAWIGEIEDEMCRGRYTARSDRTGTEGR